MHLGFVTSSERGETNRLLAGLAATLEAEGARLCGTVQINTERESDGRCDMDVRVLPQGRTIRISQDLGKGARGCRLNPEALETAVGDVMSALSHGADLLIVNKFGKHEADGQGFREAIGEAIAQEIPVLVGVNGLNVEDFKAFGEGLAEEVAPTPAALLDWYRRARADLATAAQ